MSPPNHAPEPTTPQRRLFLPQAFGAHRARGTPPKTRETPHRDARAATGPRQDGRPPRQRNSQDRGTAKTGNRHNHHGAAPQPGLLPSAGHADLGGEGAAPNQALEPTAPSGRLWVGVGAWGRRLTLGVGPQERQELNTTWH